MPGSKATRRARADGLMILYLGLGPERSLEAVHDLAARTGQKMALSTIKAYSADFDWVERARKFDEQYASDQTVRALQYALANDERDARLGRLMQDVAEARLRGIVGEALDPMKGLDSDALEPSAVIALAREGTKIARLASGQATERQEVALSTINVMIREVSVVFGEVLLASELDERTIRRMAATFSEGLERVAHAQLSAQGIRDVQVGIALSDEGDEG